MATFEIPLADAIQALRRELAVAVREGVGEDLQFSLGPIELELQVAVSREAGGEAGIKFWVVSIGGRGSRSSTSVHTVKLSLTPISASGEVRVASIGEEQPSPEEERPSSR